MTLLMIITSWFRLNEGTAVTISRKYGVYPEQVLAQVYHGMIPPRHLFSFGPCLFVVCTRYISCVGLFFFWLGAFHSREPRHAQVSRSARQMNSSSDVTASPKQESPDTDRRKRRTLRWRSTTSSNRSRQTGLPPNREQFRLTELRHRLASSNEQKIVATAIDPEWPLYRRWLMLIITLAFWSASEATYLIAFFDHFTGSYIAILPLAYVIDMLFIMNVVLHFRTGYFDGNGAKILDRSQVFWHYGRSVCGVAEMAAALPLDFLQFTQLGSTPFLRLLKIFRLYTIPVYLRILSQTSLTPRAINIITIVKMGFLWLVLSHSAACIRVLSATVGGYGTGNDGDDWNLNIALQARPTATQYLHALYWYDSLRMLT